MYTSSSISTFGSLFLFNKYIIIKIFLKDLFVNACSQSSSVAMTAYRFEVCVQSIWRTKRQVTSDTLTYDVDWTFQSPKWQWCPDWRKCYERDFLHLTSIFIFKFACLLQNHLSRHVNQHNILNEKVLIF